MRAQQTPGGFDARPSTRRRQVCARGVWGQWARRTVLPSGASGLMPT